LKCNASGTCPGGCGGTKDQDARNWAPESGGGGGLGSEKGAKRTWRHQQPNETCANN